MRIMSYCTSCKGFAEIENLDILIPYSIKLLVICVIGHRVSTQKCKKKEKDGAIGE